MPTKQSVCIPIQSAFYPILLRVTGQRKVSVYMQVLKHPVGVEPTLPTWYAKRSLGYLSSHLLPQIYTRVSVSSQQLQGTRRFDRQMVD